MVFSVGEKIPCKSDAFRDIIVSMQRLIIDFKKSQDRKISGIFLPANMTVAGIVARAFLFNRPSSNLL
jgi:hypothetical protein